MSSDTDGEGPPHIPSSAEKPRTYARMHSGRRVHLLDPSPIDLQIDDLLLGISRVHRWCGQTIGQLGYSVAQHSVVVETILVELVARKASREERLWALCHDLSEALVGDLVTPIKSVVRGYGELEERIARAIRIHVGLPAEMGVEGRHVVDQADRIAAVTEAVRLANWTEKDARRDVGKNYRGKLWMGELEPWPEHLARKRWRARFDALQVP